MKLDYIIRFCSLFFLEAQIYAPADGLFPLSLLLIYNYNTIVIL